MILVIDQGTHATRAMALDDTGHIRVSAFCPVALRRQGPDRVEQDADEIAASMQTVIQEVLAHPDVVRTGVCCAGLATQRSSVVAWDRRNGNALAPLLSWQDRRCAKWLKQFAPFAEKIKRLTGLKLSPHYGAGKLRWYLDHVAAVSQAQSDGRLAFGPLASFLLFHLLREKPLLVDHANASRTQLWNLQTRNWDPWLLDLFGIPIKQLPHCRPICHDYGRLDAADIPLTAVNGDQTAAVFALGRTRPKTAIVNMGSGAFILLPTGKKMVYHPLLLSGLARSGEKWAEYIVEGTVNGAGSALDWAAARWNLPDIKRHLPAWLATDEPPPVFINTIGGLGSPWWRPGPGPALIGRGEPWQKAVAVAESILFMLQANFETMCASGLSVSQIQISGGLAYMDGLCQRLADLTQRPVYRPAETEATARGLAWLASGALQNWPKPGRGRRFKPQANNSLAARHRRFRQELD
ncbi:MAG: hypothetical protein HGJ94_01125 [Desulfosarcina sp.]|nr:hypothetical protein [Desulfosarcina sp.]MBC2743594.1 hypothetical protein [Desulfosarcina sp.]MBC2766503.1 hypothetical protein [Desulfosarcina sp.]